MFCKSRQPLFFIFSGGPGSGKSSVLKELEKSNYTIIPETGRKIIQEQVAVQGDALPWKNKEKFRDLMVERDLQQYLDATKLEGAILFDRGIPDSFGYSKLEEIPISQSLKQAIKKYSYQRLVFMMPPWKEIYINDAERKQGFAIAVATYEATRSVYEELGYEILELPKASIDERVRIIRAVLEEKYSANQTSQ